MSLTTLALVLIASSTWAEESCCQAKLKATQDKVAGLVASWNSVSEKLANLCPEEKGKLASCLAETAKGCPIGSRLGDTLAFVRGALTIFLNADAECEKSCKKEGQETAAKSGAGCEKMAGVLQARSKLSKDLHALVSAALCAQKGGCCGPACPEKAGAQTAVKEGFCPKKASEIVASIRGTECSETASKIILTSIPDLKCGEKAAKLAADIKGSACEKEACDLFIKAANSFPPRSPRGDVDCQKGAGKEIVASAAKPAGAACCAEKAGCPVAFGKKAKELQASWDKAKAEILAFTPEQRREWNGKVSGLMEKSETMKLMPPTVQALAEGLEALASMNCAVEKMAEGQKAISEEKAKAFKASAQLIQETAEVLKKVGAAAQVAHVTPEEKAKA
ncbi:MAG: hypothetical protein HY717_04190 [Planctomycetes bacterium]|nr:hypothetical protein [Planctomycetota bacterium]